LKALCIGDIIGKPGRRAVEALLPELRQKYAIDLVIANGENTAGGIGLTPPLANALFNMGIDAITSGNHIFKHREILPYLDGEEPVLRPLNYPPGVPGKGYLLRDEYMIINLEGRVFMNDLDCPFRAIDRLLEEITSKPPFILVDFHAEATSEKGAMGVYLDGRVSAVVGTHTHIGTADARILPRGTAFVTDVGMVGPRDSVIGDDAQKVLNRFLTQMPHRLSAGKGPVTFNAVLIETDEAGKAVDIRRVDREFTGQ